VPSGFSIPILELPCAAGDREDQTSLDANEQFHGAKA